MDLRTIEIKVSDANYERLRHLLEHLTYVESIRDKGAEEQRERINVAGSKYDRGQEAANETHISQAVDEVTLMSQRSLAEEWDSEEDSVWDQYYNETKSARDATSQL